MFTREQYLKGECTHDEYYLPIALEIGVSLKGCGIAWYCLKDDTPHFESTCLHQWDALTSLYLYGVATTRALKARGDYLTFAGGVCILKTLARHEKSLGLYDHWKDKPCPHTPKKNSPGKTPILVWQQ